MVSEARCGLHGDRSTWRQVTGQICQERNKTDSVIVLTFCTSCKGLFIIISELRL